MENNVLALGTRLGRAQAFGMVATQSSAAQAECLRQMRDSDTYKSLGLTWDDFCRDHVGLTRPRVDSMISSLEEFGVSYFRLGEIVDISPETFRQIAPAVTGDAIEIDGESVPLTPENTPRIRQAVQRLRADLTSARKRAAVPPVHRLQNRFGNWANDVTRIIPEMDPDQSAELLKLVRSAIERLNGIACTVPQ